MVILQVGDGLLAGMQTFVNNEKFESNSFMSRPRTAVTDIPILFNEVEITCHRNRKISIRQQKRIKDVTVPMTEREFKNNLALVQNIGVGC